MVYATKVLYRAMPPRAVNRPEIQMEVGRVFSELPSGMCEREEFEIVTVQSGARSLRSRACGETFHPVIGPMAEAQALHVRSQRLAERAAMTDSAFVVWDVGLGAAANALAVIGALRGARAELHSFERTLAPVEFALRHGAVLGYLTPHRDELERLLRDGAVKISGIDWRLHVGDFRETMRAPALSAPHAILYDPYSPAANPELWTLEHFTRLHARLDPARPCLLTNYTRSTAVRVTLLLAGFFVGRGPATGEKDETTVATNALQLLENPLDENWFARVQRSTRAAPLREGMAGGPITPDAHSRLRAHAQFAQPPVRL
jgi:tRNA U34 5-methylaminomethyl-2-thiouridine-forming methyltransferase MnmC